MNQASLRTRILAAALATLTTVILFENIYGLGAAERTELRLQVQARQQLQTPTPTVAKAPPVVTVAAR